MATQDKAILLKIKKVKALAEQGVSGEKEAAQQLLERLCARYGITLEELNEGEARRVYHFHVRTSVYKLFLQVFTHLYGVDDRFRNEVNVYRAKNGRDIQVSLTPTEYIEFNIFFEWHRQNYLKERRRMREIFYSGYLEKHKLYPCKTDEDFDKMWEEKKSKKDLWEEMMAVSAMTKMMTDATFHKQIGSEENSYGEDDED